MNIYIHVEIVSRELDSKLLLGILAAARGHEVILSDIEGIEKNIKRRILTPGIFLTKSLTPSETKITRHQSIIDANCKITSIDEEGGLVNAGYEIFAKRRYSNKTIEMSSAVFGWGEEDIETLKNFYPKYSSKIHLTGSPRVDLWKNKFSKLWSLPSTGAPRKPYFLVISNMSAANAYMPFYERIKNARDTGYFKRDPEGLKTLFIRGSEHFLLTHQYIEAIKHLNKNNNSFDIVLRPHPVENIDSWKTYLDGMPNVYVTREGPVNAWINNAFAIMHNGCTTAYEVNVSRKPLITFAPIERETDNLTNKLGHLVKNKEDLLNKVNDLFEESKQHYKENLSEQLPHNLTRKIYIDDNELSAEKIINVWETLDNGSLSKPNNWTKYKLILKLMRFRGIIGNILKRSFSKDYRPKNNYKFPPLDGEDIFRRFKKLKKILGISNNLECKMLSQKTTLIKRS